MDEQVKFNELKKMKDQQTKLLTRGVLEQQIQEDQDRRLQSREKRVKPNTELTFGPKETDQTLLYTQLKRQNEKAMINQELKNQIQGHMTEEQARKQREIHMEKNNVLMAN